MVAFNAIYPSTSTPQPQGSPGVASGVGPAASASGMVSSAQNASGSVGINAEVLAVIGVVALVLFLHHKG